ncbi:MAG: membrane protein [Lysobacteraceae bacterium]|nr:MAG: membrane protein [Xanthomonadaceae bacterium]
MSCWPRCLTLLLILISNHAGADPLRPAYLELEQNSETAYAVLWKVPLLTNGQQSPMQLNLPVGTVNLTQPNATLLNNAVIERWMIQTPGGLAGQQISVTGLLDSSSGVLVRLELLEGGSQVARMTPGNPAFTVESQPSSLQVVSTYTVLGFEHILLGFDHLLFVLGLLLIVGLRWMVLVKTITAFTIAHSITLVLATMGVVNVPSTPVEAVIALSIMFVAGEILHARAGRPGITARAPWIVAFAFGLLHGFGFAGALMETGLPQNAIPLALLFFNVGVELGQLAFVVVVSGLMIASRRLYRTLPKWSGAVVPYAIGGLAAFWTLERVAAM